MFVSDSSAAFEGPYGEKPARRIVSRFTETLTTRPQLPRSIDGRLQRGTFRDAAPV
jgi:hypothetical protein